MYFSLCKLPQRNTFWINKLIIGLNPNKFTNCYISFTKNTVEKQNFQDSLLNGGTER